MIVKENIQIILLIILIYLSYFIGFFLNENSISAVGGYDSDLVWIWKNFDIFKNNTFIESIKSKEFFGNRSHLLYILNYYLNPFLNDIESYRLSSTIFCLIGPYFFLFMLKN